MFNFGRNEVSNFLVANALYWLEEFHIDGLRVDAVASMLYLDYSRKAGEWVPNQFGGRENLEAVAFLKEVNEAVYADHPGAMTIAEESTAWPAVSRPTYLGGLGFGFKWNMGWMHDTLDYFTPGPDLPPVPPQRADLRPACTPGTENFVLPLSHDEVVHGKGSLLAKMPGDRWQQLANLRALFAWMWAHPGKQLLFMGGELAQETEWSHDRSLDWYLLHDPAHQGIQALVRSLNRVYRDHPALWQRDFSDEGFRWIDASDTDNSVLSFLRFGTGAKAALLASGGAGRRQPARDRRPALRGQPHPGAAARLPHRAARRRTLARGAQHRRRRVRWQRDRQRRRGVGLGATWHGLPASADLTLPPLGVLWLAPG